MQHSSNRYRPTVRAALSLALPVVMLTAGCNRNPDSIDAALKAIRDGSAAAELQRYFDSHRQCAPVLTFSRERGLLLAGAGDKASAALIAAGLIEPVPGPLYHGSLTYRPVPAARRWFTPDPADKGAPLLCFARRKVKGVSLTPDLDRPSLRYTFELVDPAPWMARADVRSAFPGVALAFGNVFAGEESVEFRQGKPKITPILPMYLNSPFMDFGVNFTGFTDEERVELMDHTANKE